jgi:hypothetical protein
MSIHPLLTNHTSLEPFVEIMHGIKILPVTRMSETYKANAELDVQGKPVKGHVKRKSG